MPEISDSDERIIGEMVDAAMVESDEQLTDCYVRLRHREAPRPETN